MKLTNISAFVLVFVASSNGLFAQTKINASSELEMIKKNYLAAIKQAEGDPKSQFAAGEQRSAKCRDLVKSINILSASTELETLLALSEAAELGKLPNQATEIAHRILKKDATNTKAYSLILRGAINAGEIDKARELLEIGVAKCKQPENLLPYWGVLGVETAAVRDSENAIQCFRKYLPSRYPTMVDSTQLFHVLPSILADVSWCCLDLHDFRALHSITAEVQKEMAAVYGLKQTSDASKSNHEILWTLNFFQAEMLLESYSKSSVGLGDGYFEFVDFVNAHPREMKNFRNFKRKVAQISNHTKSAIGRMNSDQQTIFHDSLNRVKESVEGESRDSNELILASISDLQQRLATMRETQGWVDLKLTLTRTPTDIPRRKVTLCWFGNNFNHLEKARQQLLQFARRGSGTIVFVLTDEGKKKRASELLGRLATGGTSKFEIMMVEGASAAKLSCVDELVWLSLDGQCVKKCVVGSELASLQRALSVQYESKLR